MRTIIHISILMILLAGCSGEISTYEDDIQASRQYFIESKYRSAIIEAKNAIQKKPTNQEPRLLLANIYLAIKNGPAAEKEINKAEKFGADKKLAQLLRMESYLYTNKIQDVLAVKKDSIHDNEKDLVRYHVYRALAFASEKDFDKAKNELNIAKNINDKSLDYIVAKAKIAMATDDLVTVKSVIEKVPVNEGHNPELLLLQAKLRILDKENDAAIKLLDQIVNNPNSEGLFTPVNYSAYILLTNLYVETGDYQKAELAIKKIRSIVPKSNMPDYLQGLVYYKQKQYQSSKEYLQASEALNPEHAETLMLLGAVDYSLGLYNQAESYLTRYLAIYPNHIMVRRLLGITQLKLKEPAKALENFAQVIQLSPDDNQLLSVMGETAIMLGKTDIGREYLNKAIESGADKNRINVSLAKSYLAEGKDDTAIQLLLENPDHENESLSKDLLLFRAYIKSQKYNKAKTIADNIVKENPDSPVSYYLYGYYYTRVGQDAMAEKQYKKSLALNGNYIPALTNLARLYIKQEKYKEAKIPVNRIIKNNDKNVQAILMLALIEEKLGNRTGSIALLKQSIEMKPDVLLPRIALVKYYLSIADRHNALSLATETVKIFPDNSIAVELLADVQIKNKKYRAAQRTIEHAIKLNPESPANHVRLGRALASSGDYYKAKENLEYALKLRKGYQPAIESLARVELLLDNEKEAFKQADRLKKSNTDSPAGFLLAGDLYLMKRDYKQAAEEYKKALSVSKRPEIFGKYMSVLMLNGHDKKAMSLAEDWLKTYPDDYNTRMKLALTLQSSNKCKQAIPHYEYINNKIKSNVVIVNNLAMCYLNINDSTALQYAKEAYDMVPENDAVNDTYGWILVNMGQQREGLKYLNTAIRIIPSNPEYKYHKAVALYQLNRKEEAKIILRDLIAEGANFKGIDSAQELYEKM